jgi:hypothetical protein
MGWIVFMLVVGVYVVIGVKRMPVYFRRVDQNNRERWPSIYEESESHKEAAWGAIGLAAFWPYYEGGLWIRNHIIKTMTAEQRRQAEYDNAEKIVAEYRQRKEREEREAFERELKGK